MPITVNAVNDPPVNTVPGAQTVNEDTALPIAGVSVADVDGASLTTTLTVDERHAQRRDRRRRDHRRQRHRHRDDQRHGGPDQRGARRPQLSRQSQLQRRRHADRHHLRRHHRSDTDTVAITVNAVNDAPVNTVPGAQSVNEDTTLAIAGVSVADVDSTRSPPRSP